MPSARSRRCLPVLLATGLALLSACGENSPVAAEMRELTLCSTRVEFVPGFLSVPHSDIGQEPFDGRQWVLVPVPDSGVKEPERLADVVANVEGSLRLVEWSDHALEVSFRGSDGCYGLIYVKRGNLSDIHLADEYESAGWSVWVSVGDPHPEDSPEL